MNIALIDDSRSVLFALTLALSELGGVEIQSFVDPAEALVACGNTVFDLVIVDHTMPRLTGIDVIRALKRYDAYALVPIVMITSESDRAIRIEAIEAGATEFLRKPFDSIELKARVRNLLSLREAQTAIAGRAEKLAVAVTDATRDLAAREEEMIWRLARAIEFRDGHTGDHVSRVAEISRLIAEALGHDAHFCRMVYLAAPLHDVGKIGIPDGILNKPGRLTADEFARMREHVAIGERILDRGSSELVRVAARIVAGHHEKWDGSGYPRGLAGSAIPIEGRIVAVADVFEALSSERPYKAAWPLTKAAAEVVAGSGSHFDPACVAAFCRQWPQIAAMMGLSDCPPLEPAPPVRAVA
ncbi:HD domain-containing phosphohydrolase [Ensifer soli]|uniref:HD domain-containing phosphohydrolase n=1 Tax=Ciceribacter sp. sgz301302 TaxID=3342379 RepID=UPI0035B8F845